MFNNNIGWRKKLKIVVAIISISISLGYLFINFEIQGYNQAVNLLTNEFYTKQPEYQVTVPKNKETIDNLLRWTFGSEARLAKAVFKSESGLRCEAEGDANLAYVKSGIVYGKSYGVAQIRYLPSRPTPQQLLDCKFNIQYAKQLRDKQGWEIWSAYNNKSYLKNI